MSRRHATVLLAASVPIAFLVGTISPIGELGLLIVLGVFIWVARAVDGFAGGAFRGAVAGAIAGLLVLGVGLRAAMRVVAITDPARTPEFTVEGTAFLLVGMTILGSFAGAYLGALRHLLGLGRRAVAIIATVALGPILFGDSETLTELFELGLGAWVNIPMFASIVFAYGWTHESVARRLDARRAAKTSVPGVMEPLRVP